MSVAKCAYCFGFPMFIVKCSHQWGTVSSNMLNLLFTLSQMVSDVSDGVGLEVGHNDLWGLIS